MAPSVSIGIFSVLAISVVAGIFRRDFVIGGFAFFLFLYVIFALVGYAYFPLLSASIGAYFGEQVLAQAIAFLCLSFVCFFIAFWVGSSLLRSREAIGVAFRPRGFIRLGAVLVVVLLLCVESILFLQDYGTLTYASGFQGFWLQFLFKQLPATVLVLYAVGRRHTDVRWERHLMLVLAGASGALLLAIASRAGNRSDVLALLLGLVCYEGYPLVTNALGSVSVKRGTVTRNWRTILGVVTVSVLALAFMSATRATRARGLVGVPGYASLLYNDYFAPAHILFGAIALHWIQPAQVFLSNLANGTYVGRVFDVPYLQQDIGNVLMPGSSTRASSFAYYIFTEGYMVAGWWGALYNGIIPVVLLVPFRLLSRTSSAMVNALGAALAVMFFADMVRAQTALIPRYFITNALPAVMLFATLTGLRPASTSRRRET